MAIARLAKVMVVGSIGSLLAGMAIVRDSRLSVHRRFVAPSTDMAANLQVSIQHELDLVVSAQAFVLGDPNVG